MYQQMMMKRKVKSQKRRNPVDQLHAQAITKRKNPNRKNLHTVDQDQDQGLGLATENLPGIKNLHLDQQDQGHVHTGEPLHIKAEDPDRGQMGDHGVLTTSRDGTRFTTAHREQDDTN